MSTRLLSLEEPATSLQALRAAGSPVSIRLSHRQTLPPVLATLHAWADRGWLRRLDSALANHLFDTDPDSPPALWVAVACLSHLEGRGHTCLPLSLLCQPLAEALAVPPEAQAELTTLWHGLPTDVPAWVQALSGCSQVDASGTGQGAAPLVLFDGGGHGRSLLYLRRYWHDEGDVVRHIRQRVGHHRHVDESLVVHWLDRLFPEAQLPAADSIDVESKPPLTNGTGVAAPPFVLDWQRTACVLAARAGLTVITGGPGTGKTYTAARLLALLFALSPQPQHMRVALAAPTGKAAARLRQSLAQALTVLAPAMSGAPGVGLEGPDGSGLDLVGLAQRIGPARTLHALLGARPDSRHFAANARHPLDVDVLVVDEASMVNLEMMAALMRALPARAQLVLLGDKDQLSSVEAGAVLGDVCRQAHLGLYGADTARYIRATTGQDVPSTWCMPSGARVPALAQQTVMLRHSHRFGGAIGQIALAVNAGDARAVAAAMGVASVGLPDGAEVSCLTVGSGKEAEVALLDRVSRLAVEGYSAYLQAMAEGSGDFDQWVRKVLRAFENFRLLCAVHQGPLGTQELNQRVKAALVRAGRLRLGGEWFAGRPVMVTRNDLGLGVSNGDVGVVLPGWPGPDGAPRLKACFLEGDTLRTVPVGRLMHVETAFAMTVHKSQGSEFAHAVLVLPSGSEGMLTRELVYTGITRARSRLTVVEGTPGALVGAVQRQAHRHSGLARRLVEEVDFDKDQ